MMKKTTLPTIAGCALWGILSALLWWAAPVLAAPEMPQGTPAAAGNSEELRDPEALAELHRATSFLSALPRFHFQAEVVFDVIQEDGRRLQFEKHGEVYLQRPDRLYAEIFIDDGRHRQFWYDGKTISFAERSRNLHTRVKAPPTIDLMLDLLEELLKDPIPLADLYYSDLSPLEKRAFEADVVGDSVVKGLPCRHLAFRGETVDWQIWVEQGKTPFIRKLAISYREVPGVPQYVAWISGWEVPEQFDAGRFTFVPPAGSEWVEILAPGPRRVEEGGQP